MAEPLFTSEEIEAKQYQSKIPQAVQMLQQEGITNPTEQQITDRFQLGGYYQVARDIERALKYPGQILSDEGKPGEREGQSFAERSALPYEGTASTATSYFDSSRGVQVNAPVGYYFELYPGGGVKKVQGQVPAGSTGAPASSLFNQPTQGVPGSTTGETQATPGFKQKSLAYTPAEGKTIARTGQTIKNPTTGVDVEAKPGNVMIEYTDGTVEERPYGGAPGESKPIGEVGPTAQDLGITRQTEIKGGAGSEVTRAPQTAAQALAAAPTAEAKDQVIQGEGLTSTQNLSYVGTEYEQLDKNGQPTGVVRKAKTGNAFYKAADGTILERPKILSPLAKQPGQAQGVSADDLLSGYGVSANPDDFLSNPLGSFQDVYSKILSSLGAPEAKSFINDIQKQIKDLDAKYADDAAAIDENPWLSESLRTRKQKALADKYDLKKSQLTAQFQLAESVYDDAVQQAQYVATTTLNQYNQERQFQQEELHFQIEQANKKLEAEQNLALEIAKLEQGNIKEVSGGLYDIGEKQWLVPPKPEPDDQLTANAYAGIIADVYKTYDPEEADQVIRDITSRIGSPGQPLSIQSITPSGSQVGTKFGEQTFAQAHHSGVDIPAPGGSPVLAPTDMTITSIGNKGGYGNTIEAKDSSGMTYRFAHLSGYSTKLGAKVTAGQAIGKVGSTGNSTGNHLHMEVIDRNGKFIDPVEYFGLSSSPQPIKTKAQKAQEVKDEEARKAEALKLNKELVASDAYKTVRKAQDSLQYLDEFSKQFKKYGTTSQVTSPFDNAKLKAVYNSTILNLKEYFNLGVLNGPDEAILRSVLPDPTNQGLITNLSAKSATNSGINNMRIMIERTLDDRYQSLAGQYSGYSSDELTSLRDLQRVYLNQKAILNPQIKAKINQIKAENSGISDEEIIQIII